MSSLYDLHDILFDEPAAEDFLSRHNVFYRSYPCNKCGAELLLDPQGRFFRCNARSCRTQYSHRIGTFFYGTKLKCCEVLLLGRLWLDNVPLTSACRLTGHSPNTVVAFYKHFRKLVAATLTDEDQIIGGPGIVVEVDETKLGKRKYNRGHRVEGVWVVAGVERTPERRVFFVQVERRDAETLEKIITDHVTPGSVIHTDMWRGYSYLQDSEHYSHATVNHSKNFKDPISLVHTNTIEGTNNGLKMRIPVRARVRDGVDDHLFEFIWRRKYECGGLWEAFVSALAEIHYELE